MKKLFTLFVIVVLTISVFAQSPQKMSYQAVVRNASGVLVKSNPVGMKISILQGSATGTAVYIETQTPTTNENGLVTLAIGGGTPITGTFAGINWSTDIYFIKTETDPTGGTSYTITGTNQILSVPYALYSKIAGNGSLWSQSSSNIYFNSGNVGIGISDPIYNLDVRGSNSDADGVIQLGNSDLSHRMILFGGRQNDPNPFISWKQGDPLRFATDEGGWSEKMRITSDGKVGIGTSNPATYIHVYGTPVTSRGQLSLSSPAGQGTLISFYEAEIFKAFIWYDVNDQDFRLQNSAGDLNLNPYGGNVGIGTVAPTSKLDIKGEVNVNNNKIINVAEPTSDNDAANKEYVDNSIKTHQIGDFVHGGIVFWIDETGQHGLVCAKTDQSIGLRWYAGDYTHTMALGDGPLAGEMNTAIIIANQGFGDGATYPARICNELQITEGVNTYCDWYLPSKEELNLIYQNRTAINTTSQANGGTTFTGTLYWSSTEVNFYQAWGHFFGQSGSQYGGDKGLSGRVRAVRVF